MSRSAGSREAGPARPPLLPFVLSFLFFGSVEVASRLPQLEALPAGRAEATVVALLVATLWTLALWVTFRLTSHYPLTRESPFRRGGVYAGVGVLVVVLDLGIRTLLEPRLGFGSSEPAFGHALTGFLVFVLLVGFVQAIDLRRRYHARQVDELRLRGDVARAELARTQSRLRAP